MRVAFIVGEFPALSETFVLNQIVGFVRQGHEVDVYAERARDENVAHQDVEKYDLPRRTRYENLPVKPGERLLAAPALLAQFLPDKLLVLLKAVDVLRGGGGTAAAALSLRTAFAARPFLRAAPYDVLLCHFHANGQKAVRMREIGAVSGKIVTIIHGVDTSRDRRKTNKNFYAELFANGDLFLPISGLWAQYLANQGCPPDKIAVHHVGVDCELFAPRESKRNAEQFQILSVARLTEKKGLADGIRAVVKLKRADPQSRVNYTIVGEGELRHDLQTLIAELDAARFVRLVGGKTQSEVREYFRAADVVLTPSVRAGDGDCEGVPVVLMEAMACGLPVVSTRHGGIGELVADQKSGLLVAERDRDALAAALDFFWKNPNERIEFGRRGREIVLRDFNLTRQNEILIDFCRRLNGAPAHEKLKR